MGVMEAVKGMGELVKKVHDADLKSEMQQKIIDVQNDCLALQEKMSELRNENEDLKRQISEFQKRADIRSKIKQFKGYYIITDELGNRAICPTCFERSSVTIPMAKRDFEDNFILCPGCRAIYTY